MIRKKINIEILLVFIFLILGTNGMSFTRKNELKNKTKEMIFHAFNGYMKYAFPSDELHPITCNGKDRESNGNHSVNDVLGNYTLTLIDSLDTLAIVGDKEAFEKAVHDVINTVSFDINSIVQVFEVTIRILGGLLSAHLFAINDDFGVKLDNYNDELLDLAYDLGKRLLPAFTDSKTDIPLVRINLQTGSIKNEIGNCPAGAGTLLLEFGTLSRLTGDMRFEYYARKALFKLWEKRSSLGLFGNGINSETSSWDYYTSGIGAGIDSLYEYMLKGYILFGDPDYLKMFIDAYSSIKSYIKNKDGLYFNVNMNTGQTVGHNMDGLAAFFPGLLVLMGDIESAIHLHQIYTELWKKYHAIPELYNFKYKEVIVNSYLLRPEFIESNYMLYQATKDPYYLEIGEMILNDIEEFCRTECGYAQLSPLTSFQKEDRMESFLISESLKYLYLLFDEDNIINSRYTNSIFTTEGHFLLLPRSVYNKKSYEDSSFLNANPHTNITCPHNIYNMGKPLLPKNEMLKIYYLVNGIKNADLWNEDMFFV